ncbi:MAG: dTMP kinase [Pseudomonadota bacterium]
MTLKGYFIALEGIDGSGTSTQANLLVDYLSKKGPKAHLTCEPSSGSIGQLLRKVLRGELKMDPATVALLFAADRVDHVRSEIQPKLEKRIHVVTDRYVYSSLTYQSIDQNLDWVSQINSLAPEPDLTIYLRLDPRIAAERMSSRSQEQEIYETIEQQSQVAENYDTILGSSPNEGSWRVVPPGSRGVQVDPSQIHVTSARKPKVAIIDGGQSISEIQFLIPDLVDKSCPIP